MVGVKHHRIIKYKWHILQTSIYNLKKPLNMINIYIYL